MNGGFDMSAPWIEEQNGYFFRRDMIKSSSMWAELEMLCYEDMAIDEDDGVRITWEKALSITEDIAELLELPKMNPYQLSITTKGDLGHSDIRYIIEILKPDGTTFINPTILGINLHINSETIYRLNHDQYELVRLSNKSNVEVTKMNNREAMGYNLINASAVQKYAKSSNAKLDNTLSYDNTKIVIPKRLDIELFEENDGNFSIKPILLTEDDGKLEPVESDDFQQIFGRRSVQNIYMGKDRTRYVCSPKVKAGLQEIKKYSKISKQDAERYQKQPRELFSDDIFLFSNEKEDEEDKINLFSYPDEWLPGEGEIDINESDAKYSSRVTGIINVKGSIYYGGSNKKTNWLVAEGNAIEQNRQEEQSSKNSNFTSPENQNNDTDQNATLIKLADMAKDGITEDSISKVLNAKAKRISRRKQLVALGIKTNAERIDYAGQQKQRTGIFQESALKDGIKLLDHQKQGVNWIFEQWEDGYQGVLLADDMGLGKTLQTLAFIAGIKKNCSQYHSLDNPILIVAPTSLLDNWSQEFDKFVKKDIFSEMVELRGQSLKQFETGKEAQNGKRQLKLSLPKDSIALTTYETLRDYQFSFAEVQWSIIIVDEAQKIKNPSTGITMAIKAMKYDFAICLSGTPVENSWIDLWSIMDFVQPAMLNDLKTFRSKYIARLSDIEDDEQAIESLGRSLKESLTPLFLRRMKKDNLNDIPEKHVYKCKGEMPNYQKNVYISVIRTAHEQNLHPLQVIARLRDVSLHPDIGTKNLNAFFEMDIDDVINQSARLIETFKIIEQVRLRHEKVLIFLVSKKMQVILKHLISEKYGINIFAPINGEMNGRARQHSIDRFNESDGFNVLILSPEAAGVGFTITSANNVIHLSRTWNPAKEEQATDRAYRIGQKKDVNVYIPMACHKDFGQGGSFDEMLDELLEYKRVLSENVLFPTEDSSKDGIKIYNDINNIGISEEQACYWSIKDIDLVTGDVFERIISDLYRTMGKFDDVVKTQSTNDNGADVIALDRKTQTGLLFQCKHKEKADSMIGNSAVQEIAASVKYYESIYPDFTFSPLVITNAIGYTRNAEELAEINGVQLIARDKLTSLIKDTPVLKY